ncbi:MAG: histidine phosphatase family protein [Marinibacterium sp.]|nr:histidine phosphatase family protein [Marinibacterium sp.]
MAEAAAHVIVIRHGAYHQRAGVPSARQPFALTDEGRAQARACADLVAAMVAAHGLRLAPVVMSSHQLRAWQTAHEICDALPDLERVEETGALAERGLGSAANLTVPEIEAVLRDDPRHDPAPAGWKSDSDYRLPLEGAESLMEAGARVAAHLQAAAARAVPGTVSLHVGHGASLRHGCHHLGLLTRDRIAALSMFHARPLLLCYNGHDRWSHLAGDWKVRGRDEAPID